MKSYRLIKPPRVLALAFAVVLPLLFGNARADALFSFLSTNYVETPRITRYHLLSYDLLYLTSVGISTVAFDEYPTGTVVTAKWVIGFGLNDDGINWQQLKKTAVVIQSRESYSQFGPVYTNSYGRVVTPGILQLEEPEVGRIVLEPYEFGIAYDDGDLPNQLYLVTAKIKLNQPILAGIEYVVSLSFEVDTSHLYGKLGDLEIIDIGYSPGDGAAGPIGVDFAYGTYRLTSASIGHSYTVPMSELSIDGFDLIKELKLDVRIEDRQIVVSWPASVLGVILQRTDDMSFAKWTNCVVPIGDSEYRAPTDAISGYTVYRAVQSR